MVSLVSWINFTDGGQIGVIYYIKPLAAAGIIMTKCATNSLRVVIELKNYVDNQSEGMLNI